MTHAKRAFDLFWATLGIMALSPIMAVVAVMVRLDDGGPVLFSQLRVGREGRIIRVLKFRTMVTDAERLGGALTAAGDPRITRPGRWLRRWKIDELPQLFNVLRGEMSLVGPRPEVPRFVALYSPSERRILRFTPGITDPASIRFRNEGSLLAAAPDTDRFYSEWVLPEKIRMSLEYAERATVRSDFATILQTLLPPREDPALPGTFGPCLRQAESDTTPSRGPHSSAILR